MGNTHAGERLTAHTTPGIRKVKMVNGPRDFLRLEDFFPSRWPRPHADMNAPKLAETFIKAKPGMMQGGK